MLHVACGLPQRISDLPVACTQEVKQGEETRFSPSCGKQQWPEKQGGLFYLCKEKNQVFSSLYKMKSNWWKIWMDSGDVGQLSLRFMPSCEGVQASGNQFNTIRVFALPLCLVHGAFPSSGEVRLIKFEFSQHQFG